MRPMPTPAAASSSSSAPRAKRTRLRRMTRAPPDASLFTTRLRAQAQGLGPRERHYGAGLQRPLSVLQHRDDHRARGAVGYRLPALANALDVVPRLKQQWLGGIQARDEDIPLLQGDPRGLRRVRAVDVEVLLVHRHL